MFVDGFPFARASHFFKRIATCGHGFSGLNQLNPHVQVKLARCRHTGVTWTAVYRCVFFARLLHTIRYKS